jgi:hypothetical protein
MVPSAAEAKKLAPSLNLEKGRFDPWQAVTF